MPIGIVLTWKNVVKKSNGGRRTDVFAVTVNRPLGQS